MTVPALFKEEPAKLIVNRRAIAAGLASLMALPVTAKALAKDLDQLANIPLTTDLSDFAHVMRDGLFRPDYRKPMVRIVFENGEHTCWHRYVCRRRGEWKHKFIEVCAPDKNGMPRFAQLEIE